MRSDKEVKKEFLITAQHDPDAYYATTVLRRQGFVRKQCEACSRFFWSTRSEMTRCGDSVCQGRVSIFEDNPSKSALTFTDVWKTFAAHMAARGYAVVPRYPVVARWNPTTDFTMASIAAFQPYVVSGEVDPPAKKLVIPQFSLRFGDVDNVGVTGSHCTGFVMIGQKQFVPPEEWDQNQAFEDLFTYLTDVLGLSKDELTLHEDAWAGGGNFGPCMEFFSRGVELCNQVYMMFEQTPDGNRPLRLKVLDMGLGQERIAWFTQGAPTVYDAAFPAVLARLVERTGVQPDRALYRKFAPFATLLNVDEVEDLDVAWASVAAHVGVPVVELRAAIEPMKALYSVAEHARALLVALADGALPGNVGGYYNLRVIFRRAQQFIDAYGWEVSLAEVARWHADELRPLFPDLAEQLPDVERILSVEVEKFRETKKRGAAVIAQALKKPLDTDALVRLYVSHGIAPEDVRAAAHAQGVSVTIPDAFFRLVADLQESAAPVTQTSRSVELDVSDAAETELLFYQSYDYAVCKAVVLKMDGVHVVLDRTVFYPTSGGQLHDTGTIDGVPVVDVFKQGRHIVHVLRDSPSFNEGDTVHAEIDIGRRIQLAQHHTAAHVVNGAARVVLGNHVWQAGAAKTVEKGRLDITHFDALSAEEMRRIEGVANEVVRRDLPVVKQVMKKTVAEQEFGFRLYQGGAVPGNTIRVIDIPGFDTEACGGTHVNTTGDLQLIKLLKSTKVQDGVVRIEYVAGGAAHGVVARRHALLKEAMQVLGVDVPALLPARTAELFRNWKRVQKLRKAGAPVPADLLVLSASAVESVDPVAEAAAVVSVQEEHLPRTLRRFLADIHTK